MNIDLTDREIELLMDCLGTNIETIKQRHTVEGAMAELIEELFELETDLREALHRKDDGWGDPEDPDLHMDPVDFAAKHDTDRRQIVICDAEINAETQMFNAGVEAREKAKANSRAAGRRALNFAGRDKDEKSEMQQVDVWEKPSNDPADW